MDWITGERFKQLADFCYSPTEKLPGDYDHLVNTFDGEVFKLKNIIYTHTMYVQSLFNRIAGIDTEFIVLTHNSDINVEKGYNIPRNVRKWFSTNVNYVDPILKSIPIGLENERWFPELRKKEKMIKKLTSIRKQINLVYMNHNLGTNYEKRIIPQRLFENKSWVTTVNGENGKGFDEYLDNIYNHPFVICPDGNGIDTHRLWEVLYMGNIPIVKCGVNHSFYMDLPILCVNDWEEVTEPYLKEMNIQMHGRKWNWSKLTFEYWKQKIQQA